MKYLSQFLIIMGFTLLGEALQRLIPLPIPASVYGLALLFVALCLKIVKLEQIREVGGFMTSILPVLFVSPAVGIIDCWTLISPNLLTLTLLIVVSTAVTFGVAGKITQWFTRKDGVQHD